VQLLTINDSPTNSPPTHMELTTEIHLICSLTIYTTITPSQPHVFRTLGKFQGQGRAASLGGLEWFRTTAPLAHTDCQISLVALLVLMRFLVDTCCTAVACAQYPTRLTWHYWCQLNFEKYEDGLLKIQKIHSKSTRRSTNWSIQHLYFSQCSMAKWRNLFIDV